MTLQASERQELEALCARLTREPDFDAPELRAFDATDQLLLDTAAVKIHTLNRGELVVIGDSHGALTLGATFVLGARGVRTHQDALLGERALAQNAARIVGGQKRPTGEGSGEDTGACAGEDREGDDNPGGDDDRAATGAQGYTSHPLDESLLRGARVVLLQLPRGLEALDDIVNNIARFAAPDVVVFAGGRVKHMTRAMNGVLGRYFREVSAGLGWRKSRVLTASGLMLATDRGDSDYGAGHAPRSPAPSNAPGDAKAIAAGFPKWGCDPDLSFEMAAYGATFGGATLDHGSRLLLAGLTKQRTQTEITRVVDLGCGNGVLAVSAALLWPGADVIASDQSAAAVAATRLTAQAAGVDERVSVYRADATEAVPDGWADLILLNPPFHTGSTVHAGVAHRLIRSCARALAPGGELRIVFNSHLSYRPLIERVIGPCEQLARDRTFTVLSAIKR